MPRRIDHVEDGGVALLVALPDDPGHPHGLALDRDATLTLDVHPVEILRTHLPRINHAGDLQHPVGQGRLAMVDMRDDAEVADATRIGRSDDVHAGVERSRHDRPFFSAVSSKPAASQNRLPPARAGWPPAVSSNPAATRSTRADCRLPQEGRPPPALNGPAAGCPEQAGRPPRVEQAAVLPAVSSRRAGCRRKTGNVYRPTPSPKPRITPG